MIVSMQSEDRPLALKIFQGDINDELRKLMFFEASTNGIVKNFINRLGKYQGCIRNVFARLI